MALFRRNKTEAGTIPELQEYYNAERRERASLAWLLALVSVACVALVLIGLFFGGRWLYNRLADNMGTETVSVETTEQNDTEPAEEAPVAETEDSAPQGEANTDATPPAQTTPTPQTPTPTPAPTPAPAQNNPAPVAVAPRANSNLPRSGPASMLAIFAVTAGIATLIYQATVRRKA